MKNEVLLKICDMIASGEIPKEVYNKYLGDTPIGFMRKYEIEKFLIKEQNKNRGKWWEDRLHFLLRGLIQNCAAAAVEHYIDYNDKERLAKEYAHRINLWMVYGYGTILSFDEFYECVKTGSFIDYDGTGYFIDNETGEKVKPLRCNCDWLRKNKPENSDYVMWFNK